MSINTFISIINNLHNHRKTSDIRMQNCFRVAEKIFKILPEKTHIWDKLIKPNTLKINFLKNNFYNFNHNGVVYNPLTDSWKYSNLTNINYIFHALKS